VLGLGALSRFDSSSKQRTRVASSSGQAELAAAATGQSRRGYASLRRVNSTRLWATTADREAVLAVVFMLALPGCARLPMSWPLLWAARSARDAMRRKRNAGKARITRWRCSLPPRQRCSATSNGAQLEHFGVTTTFFRDGDKFMVRTDGPDGALREYTIAYTFGVYPLQQYLIAMPGGRLQALGIAWDSRPKEQGGQRWFPLYPEQKLKPGNPLHWTGGSP
jgi:hypothetical protein